MFDFASAINFVVAVTMYDAQMWQLFEKYSFVTLDLSCDTLFREHVSASQNGLGSHFALLFNYTSVI